MVVRLGAIMASQAAMQFVVLEQAIQQEIARRDQALASRFSVLPHFLPPDLLQPLPRPERPVKPIRLGLLGLATPQKGLLNFMSLAREAQLNFPGEFEFELIGRLHEDFRYLKEECEQLTCAPLSDGVLSREEFVERIAHLDFALFLFAGGHYDLTASGVLVDCMALEVPVIARPKAIIQQVSDQAGGPIGLICPEGQELDMLEQVRKTTTSECQQFRQNLRLLADQRRPERLAELLAGLLPVATPAARERHRA